MVVAKSLDKTRFLYTEHTDGMISSVEERESSVYSAKSAYKESETWTLLKPRLQKPWLLTMIINIIIILCVRFYSCLNQGKTDH